MIYGPLVAINTYKYMIYRAVRATVAAVAAAIVGVEGGAGEPGGAVAGKLIGVLIHISSIYIKVGKER